MDKTILKFDYKHWLLRPVTILLFVLWIAVLLFATNNTTVIEREQKQQQQKVAREQAERLAKHIPLMDSFATGKKAAVEFWDDARNAYDIGTAYGKRYLVKEALPLAPLSVGQSNLHYSVVTISTLPDSWFVALKKANYLSNPHNSIFGDFDVASAIVMLLPLLIVAFNFSLLSAEKEDGRLPMLLAQGLSVRSFLQSKILFRFIVTTALTWLVVLIAFYVNGFSFFLNGGSVLFFTLLLFLYSALWHLACMLVNLFRKSSDYNAGILFTAWISWVLVIPAISTALVSAVKPIPGKVKLIDEVRETLTAFDQKNSQILDQFYTDHPQFVVTDSSKMMPLFMYKYMIKYRNTLNALTPMMNEYKEAALSQSQTGAYLSALSPAMLFQEAADEISGHSQTQFLLFQQYADAVNLDWNNYFGPLALANHYLTTEEFENLPVPVYQTSVSTSKLTWLVIGLLGWLLVLLLFVRRKFNHYKLIQ